jgi:hypothetical protein
MEAGRRSRRSGVATASGGVLPCSSPVIPSRRDAGRSSCNSGLAGASGGEAG